MDITKLSSHYPALLVVSVVAFAAGFGVAWVKKPAGSPVTPEPLERNHPSLLQPGNASQGHSRSPEFYEAHLSELREHRRQIGKLREKLDQLSPDELPELLDALSATAGLNGLSSEDESLLKRILGIWYQEDSEAALTWVRALSNEKDRLQLLHGFVELEGKEDLDRAFALLDELRDETGAAPRVPVIMLEKAAARDAETLMRACLAGLSKRSGSGGTELIYGDDFDFEAILNGLAEAVASAPAGHNFSTLPSNLIKEWAKRDPQAALDWTFEDKKVPFNSGVKAFIDGYREVASDSEVGTLVAELQEAKGDYAESWAMLNPLENEGIVRQFLESASDLGTAEEHLGGLLRASMTHVGDNTTRTMLLSMMDAESRYRLFTSQDGIPNLEWSRNALRPVLLRLGHSLTEVEQMLGTSKGMTP